MSKFEDKKLFICGQWKKTTKTGIVWEFQGVFSTKALAEAACINSTYFYFPAKLNEQLPNESVAVPDACYPKQ